MSSNVNTNKDDLNYIKKITERLPRVIKSELVTAYKSEWIKAYDAELLEHRKENAGRFAANTLIRKLVRKYMETNQTGIPRICDNCEHCIVWQGQRYCEKFKQEIPIDFATTENDCAEYQNDIPF